MSGQPTPVVTADPATTGATVITGLGVVAPNGLGVEAWWRATLSGQTGLARVSRFDPSGYAAQIAGEVNLDFAGLLPSRLLPQTDHMTRLALLAAEEALADAGADPRTLPDYDCGVLTAASGGGFEFGHRELEALWSKGGRYVSAYQSFAWFYPVNTGQISIRHGMRGAGGALVAEQAGGLDAVAQGRRNTRHGTPLMLAGGVDGSLSPWSWLCLTRSRRLSPCADPRRAYLPFDADASGWVPGEGGAFLVLETEQAAARRGARHRYGEIAGYAATFDPHPSSGRRPGLRRAIVLALADAGVTPDQVDVIFADASGVAELDRVEAEAIAEVFGPCAVPVTVPKTMTGRLLAGGGPLDLAAAVLALRDGIIPPTVQVDHPAHAELLDLVGADGRAARLACALVLARGHGGHNSAMVVRRCP